MENRLLFMMIRGCCVPKQGFFVNIGVSVYQSKDFSVNIGVSVYQSKNFSLIYGLLCTKARILHDDKELFCT